MRLSSLIGLPLAALIFVTDRLSKMWIVSNLSLQQTIPLFKNWGGIDGAIVHATNTGAAWGAFGGFQLPLLALRIFLIICLLVYLLFFNKLQRYVVPIWMILAGAISNVVDTFLYGHVVDMIKVVLWGYHFPIFNIADSAISIGIFLLFILSFFHAAPAPKSN